MTKQENQEVNMLRDIVDSGHVLHVVIEDDKFGLYVYVKDFYMMGVDSNPNAAVQKLHRAMKANEQI
jgi:hypothetical protein